MAREDQLFANVKFLIDAGIIDPARNDLSSALSDQGGHSAASVFDATHIITDTLDFQDHHDVDQEKTVAVTPLWVKRCVEHQKLQDPKYYSPHPGKIMSGVVATSSDLPRNDVEALCAGVIAYGGQWRHAFTKDVTHLFCLAPQGDKYTTAMHHKDKMGLEVLIPAWFQDCVQLQQRLPTGPYSFPNPARYKPLASLDPIGAVDHPAESIDSKLKSVSNSMEKNILFRTVSEAEGKHQKPDKLRKGNIWQQRIVILGKDLGLQDNLLKTVEASIERNGGFVSYDEDKVLDVDFFICRYRHGAAFKEAVTHNVTIGTVAWVFHCEQIGKLTRPMDQLCHFPIPFTKIKDFDKYEITVTNYTGESRDYLKNLIDAIGGKFSATMSKANTHVIAAHLGGQKAERALGWNIPIVNHTWLEDCFLEWKNIPIGGVAGSKYSKFPAGVNFMSILGERGFLGFQDTDPRKILGDSQDAASSSVSNGKHAKRPRLEQVTTGSGEVTPQPRHPAGETSVPSGPSRPLPSAKKTQEPAPSSKPEAPSDDRRRNEGDGNATISKRASNAADTSTPRRPGHGESPTPKGAKPPSSGKKKPVLLQASDAMDIDNGPGFANTDESDVQLDVAPVAGPSNLGLKKSTSRHQRPASEDEEDDMDRIQRAGLDIISKPPSKQTGKAKKAPSSKSKHAADATDGPSSSSRVAKAVSNPSLSGPPSDDLRGGLPHPLPPELAGLKRSKTDPNLLILDDDENEEPTAPKKKPAKKRKAVQAAPIEVVSSSAQSSRGASVSEAESAQTDPISAVPGRLKRGAAARAEAQLRDHVMPDLVRHQKDLKSSQGDVRKLHVVGVPSSSRKRGRGEEPESDSEDSDGDRPSSRRRKVDGPGSSKLGVKASSKGKGKAKPVEEDEDEESESSSSTSNAPVAKPQKRVVIDIDGDDLSDASTTTKKKGRTPWIMTTSYDLSPKDEEKLIKMGAKKADDMTKCTHLIAGKGILRTVKFMAAVASGVQIVTPDWVKASLKSHSFVDSDPYLPKDLAGEKKYGFKLHEALKRAREKKLFKGHKFWITKSLFPDFNDLKTVIQACGGEATKEMVKDRYLQGQSDKRHVISCKEDRIHWNGLPKLEIPVYGKDFVYNSAFRQIADWDDAQVWSPNSTDP